MENKGREERRTEKRIEERVLPEFAVGRRLKLLLSMASPGCWLLLVAWQLTSGGARCQRYERREEVGEDKREAERGVQAEREREEKRTGRREVAARKARG